MTTGCGHQHLALCECSKEFVELFPVEPAVPPTGGGRDAGLVTEGVTTLVIGPAKGLVLLQADGATRMVPRRVPAACLPLASLLGAGLALATSGRGRVNGSCPGS